jgi:hypothetical protein
MIKKIFLIMLFTSTFAYSQNQTLPVSNTTNNYTYSPDFMDRLKTIVALLKTYFVFTDNLPDGQIPIKVKYGNAFDLVLFAWKNPSGCVQNCSGYTFSMQGVASGLFGCDRVLYYTADNGVTHDFNRAMFDLSNGCGAVYFYPPSDYCASGLSGTCNINPAYYTPVSGYVKIYDSQSKNFVQGGAMYGIPNNGIIDGARNFVNPYPYQQGTKILTSIPTISQNQFPSTDFANTFNNSINSFPDYAKNYLQTGYIEASGTDITGVNAPVIISSSDFSDYTDASSSSTTSGLDLTPLTSRWDKQFNTIQPVDTSSYTSTASNLWQDLKTSAEAIPNFLKSLFISSDEWDGCFTFDFTSAFQGGQKTTFCLSEIPNWSILLPTIRGVMLLVSFILGYYFFLESE